MNRNLFVSVFIVFTGFLIYTSCTKLDKTDLGNDLIPAVDNVNTFDTVFNVTTDNILFVDSTRTFSRQPSVLGVIANDPEFGKTESSIYFSISPSSFGTYPFVNKDSIVIDSVVLALAYSGVYGDSTSQQKIDVFKIDPASPLLDSSYHVSDAPLPVISPAVGSKLVDFQTLNDSLTYINNEHDTIKTINLLRIKLDTVFGRQLMNYDTATAYKNDSIFRTLFPGLALKINEGASPLKNGLAYFDLSNAATQLLFYYRVQTGGKLDTITTGFTFSGREANLLKRTPANNYLTYLNNGIGNNDDKIFIQSSPGSYANIKIPGLENLSNRIIHRAELIVEKIPSALDNIYTAPPELFIDGVNATGDSTFTIRNDFVYTGSGLGYDQALLEGHFRHETYTFNLSRYVQSIVTKKLPSRTLRIYAPYMTYPYFESSIGTIGFLPDVLFINAPIGANRVVLGGGSHPTQKMRLRIIYSKI